MPEAPVHKNHCSVLLEYDVGSSRHAAILKAVAQTPGMEPAADHHLWSGIPSANVAHVELPLLRSQYISHWSPRRQRLPQCL